LPISMRKPERSRLILRTLTSLKSSLLALLLAGCATTPQVVSLEVPPAPELPPVYAKEFLCVEIENGGVLRRSGEGECSFILTKPETMHRVITRERLHEAYIKTLRETIEATRE